MPNLATKKTLRKALQNGAILRFTWLTGATELINPANNTLISSVDGRTYNGFLHSTWKAAHTTKFETGSIEQKNLIIEWQYTG
jgi:hypothetical protein